MPVSECNGASIYYEDYGEGQPLVFLHGAWMGLRFFEAQLTSLSADHRTVAFDFRGHGRSEHTEDGHTVSQYARDLDAFLRQRQLDDVVLVGWSMGAGVTWAYVEQFGSDRVRGLVNVDSELTPLAQEGYPYGRMSLEELSNTLSYIQSDHLGLIERANEMLVNDAPSRELETMMFDEASRTPPAVKTAIYADTLGEQPSDLSALDVPMLVCAGADETFASVEAVKHVAELVPDSRFELFEESGHCITVEEPERFNAVLRDFVASL